MVSKETRFTFDSPVLNRTLDFGNGRTVNISVYAQHHEYRVWRADGSSVPPTPWQSLSPGQSRTFQQLKNDHNLPDVPLLFEWCSINQNGGREMIRSAWIFIELDAPQVVGQVMHTPFQSEVYRRLLQSLLGAKAVRGSFLQNIANLQSRLNQITNAPASQ
ncbi:hypothetical protein [Chloroflexus sp.]|uniref:hypothetical protein n=1 Tax=Chloroflexus sp. TaxID=1904827 RepID=UPI00404B3826